MKKLISSLFGIPLAISGSVLLSAANAPANEADPEAVARVMAGESDTANAAWWGFDPEDSTEAIQAAFDSPADRVIIPKTEEPWIVRPLHVRRGDLEIIFEEGAHLMAKEGEFRGLNDSMIEFRDVENIVLKGYGATLQMRKEDYQNPPYEPAEWRMCLIFRGCRNVEILGLTLLESGGDGIYLGPSVDGGRLACEEFVIRDVVADGHHRQGMSVISARNLLVENSVFGNTRGTGPSAGICLEPNRSNEYLENIVIRNCLFDNNHVLGMHVWLGHLRAESPPVSVLWDSNYVRGGHYGIHFNTMVHDGPRGTIEYRNNIVEGSERNGLLVRRQGAGSVRLVFDNNLFFNVAVTEGGGMPRAPIVLHAQSPNQPRQGGIEFRNTFVYDDRDRPAFLVTGIDGFEGWHDVTGEITVANPHGARWDVDSEWVGEDFTLTINGQSAAGSGEGNLAAGR